MSNLFEDRERAAEYGYAHGEELRFLASRDAAEALARWAAEEIGLSETGGDAYAAEALDRLIAGGGFDLVAKVRADLEHAGKPDIAARAGSVFDRALAEATTRLHGTPSKHEPAPHPAAPATHHPNAFWGW